MPWLNFRIWVVGLPVVAKGLNMSDFLQLSSSFVLATFPIKFQNQFLWRLKPCNNHIQFLFLFFFFFLGKRFQPVGSWPSESGSWWVGLFSVRTKKFLQEQDHLEGPPLKRRDVSKKRLSDCLSLSCEIKRRCRLLTHSPWKKSRKRRLFSHATRVPEL